ncbi:hypothetical protein BV25DRAFT_1793389 [Artomyces pyxidatus]|uniref:Uncharacterized protein n=1 Tax=Artomyces pyxidatus TaxID=48021 RepID=A0ACB8TIH7_9AGAM|nr:hypothetical protein BV25DRAFT_1793389 [Artomyces pyxidatus]
MWWLDPGKEVLNVIFNRILAPYVENLDMNQVNYGIGQGQITLKKLRLKKGALDKFRLPVDVIEGHLGKFTLSLHWLNLGNQPVELLIEDVYLLVVPSPQGDDDPEENERRIQAAKAERLQNAELLHVQSQATSEEDSPQQQGLLASLTAKIVNNLQVTIKNIHVRYEDKLSVPGHPFSAGLTLAGFSAISVNDDWIPTFIESTAGTIHKLAKLQSLAVYFDTDAKSMAGLPYETAVEQFTAMIAREDQAQDHQFILKPVTGEGRIVMHNKPSEGVPRFDVQLLFDEIGVLLDDNQYRDAISLVDMYHFYARKNQYAKYRPSDKELQENQPKALLKFAGKAILDGVHERKRKWTWAFFAERRDDRHRYIELFKKKQLNTLTPQDITMFEALERKLTYEDIRFYRSIARSELRKDDALRKKLEEEKKTQETSQSSSWSSWLWGSSTTSQPSSEESAFHGPMTEQQRKELYEVLDYDERAALAESFEAPRDALKLQATAKLKKGSFALKTDPHGVATEIISVIFDAFQATFMQRRDNFEISTSLGGFRVFDGTTKDTLFPQIVHVKSDTSTATSDSETSIDTSDPFFYVKFEKNPLDDRADTALDVRMRHMEIIYHRGYVEAIYNFLKPPANQLESVEALLNVASETLEGLRKETRAGLEYALQSHKTIDLQVDMNAPIIIIPESITNHRCTHLVIDAGHIAIESDLADKEAVRQIHLKRNQKYTDDDYTTLESLMYDKFSLRLEAAQFILGDDLQSCRNALTSQDGDKLHLIERINIELQVQNSIVPSAVNLSRFKISGKLPTLQLNFSDTKYKSIMRLIDVTIPRFGNEPDQTTSAVAGTGYQLSSGIFSLPGAEYTVDDDTDGSEAPNDEFFEARDRNPEVFAPLRPLLTDSHVALLQERGLEQKQFELTFQVDTLRASISRSQGAEGEKPLGNVAFNNFSLALGVAKYDIKVAVHLGSLSMNLIEPDAKPMEVITSADGSDDGKDLLTVNYTRVQKISPEFTSKYEGFDQSVDVKISTVIFRAAPEPVLTMYDFIMTTFVPQSSDGPADHSQDLAIQDSTQLPPPSADQSQSISNDKLRVLVKLASVQVILVNAEAKLATLSLSTADASVILQANTMGVHVRLGNLSLSDDTQVKVASPEFKKLMSIEGDRLAEFKYQTYDPQDKETYRGVKSSVSLTTASLKLHYLEQPLHDIYVFVMKLARLKGLYDAATEVAVQRASEIERMEFQISVQSPILVFPSDASRSSDTLIMRLGEITASNSYADGIPKTKASLKGIQLVSSIFYGGQASVLKMIDDIEIVTEIVQGGDANDELNTRPDAEVIVKVSDVKLSLTQVQYKMLIALSQSIPKILAGAPEGAAQAEDSAHSRQATGKEVSRLEDNEDTNAALDLRPELVTTSRIRTTVDLVLTISAIKLHLYDQAATEQSNVKDHGIARFALTSNSVRFKLLSDGAMEAQVVLKSFTMSNTLPGNSKFREIIPAAQHERNQFMLLYTSTGGDNPSSLAVLTVDSPRIIFAIAPVFALLEFFTSAFPAQDGFAETATESPARSDADATATESQSSTLQFRVDLHDVSISIIENDMVPDSQAIRLTVAQISFSQQGILALNVERAGMSLTRMGKGAEEARFLDELDFTLSLDSRTSSAHQMTSIEMNFKPIVLRASYRDIKLMLTIVNKATEAYARQTQSDAPQVRPSLSEGRSSSRGLSLTNASRGLISRTSQSRLQPVGKARVLLSKEQLKASFDGFRLILIGDIHEQPLLYLKVKPFGVGVKDWSGELQASTTLASSISFWNLTNSHWEPLMDPWTFTASVSREHPQSALTTSLSAREKLNLNLSTNFIELAVDMLNVWNTEGERVIEKARGSNAPYRIRNCTGTVLYIWSDADGSPAKKDSTAVKIDDGEVIDWRFDDWRTMREHTSSGESSIALQFVGQPWEQLRGIPVDREGEYTFSLRPRTEKLFSRILCEVKVEGNLKVVTLRSTYKIHNQTLYPLELTLLDDAERSNAAVVKIAPGQDYSLPIDVVGRSKIKIQPDQGFGYKWSPAIRWEDLIAKQVFTLKCPHTDSTEAPFRFHAHVDTDASNGALRRYPKIDLKLRAPIELENLLPYNLQYRIYDKDTDQNWRSYLRKGGVMPIHSVELGHLVLLNVEVQDTVFKPSDFGIISTDGQSDFDVESKLSLQDPNGRKLDLRLNYVRYLDAGGAFKVQIYSPYLVVNKTTLPFSVRSVRSNRAGPPQDVAGDQQPDVLSSTTPFMLSHPSDLGNEFVFKVGQSTWSKIVNVEAPVADTELTIASQTQKSEEVHVGLSWTEGLGKYKLTKVITLAPRFLIKNNLSEPICFREHGVAPRGRSSLEPGERTPMHSMRMGYDKFLTVAFPGLNTQWSPPIGVEDIGSVYVRLKEPGEQGRTRLLRVDVKMDGAVIFIFINSADDNWPFSIENDSDYPLAFLDQDQAHGEAEIANKSYPRYDLPEHTATQYAWDFPASREKKILLIIKGARRAVDILEIGDLIPFRFSNRQGAGVVSLDVRASGHKQILRITNYVMEQSLYRPKYRASSSTLRVDTISGSHEALFEAVTEDLPPTFAFHLDFEGIGISLINRRVVEIIYLSSENLKFDYTSSAAAQAVNISCGVLQIDNQLHDALYPVVLQPTPISKEASDVAALPCIQGSVIWLNDQEHGVLFVKYCSILLQALTIEADEDFLFAVYELSRIRGASWEDGQKDVLIEHAEDIPEPEDTSSGQDLYFEVIELQPIRLSLSFMRTERVSGEEKLSIRNPLAVVVNALTMAVGNVNDAPLELNALAIKDMRLTLPDLQTRITYHYRQEVLRQLYRILGSADFIGNPVGLFTNVSSGVADIFYEPFNGAVMHGNRELGIGIAKGAASFVKKTVFGVSDSVTKITGSIGKGLSAATLDSEYQKRRRMNQRRNKPRHAIYGMAAGAEAFASSIASGVEGIVMKPIEGAESEGALGFFKGVGKGMVGAVTKPVVGFFDLASNLSEGVRNTTMVFDNPARDRVRVPRHIPADGIPYSAREALGQYWMKDLEHGAYRQDSYVAHINLPNSDNVVLLTATRVLSFWTKTLRLEWELPFTVIQGVTIEDKGIRFANKAGKEHDKFVLIPDKSSQSWFFGQIASVVKTFNARRRMDS